MDRIKHLNIMARRFTDTEKWSDPWFSDLDNESRLLWLYLCDKCSYVGIWKVNFREMRFFCNSEKSDDQIKQIFNDRIIELKSDKWFIPKFLSFQYPKGLQSNKPAIIGIRNEIIRLGIETIVSESLGNDYLIIKDKEQEKVKDKGKEQEQEKPDPDDQLKKRETKFRNDVMQFKQYPLPMLNAFILYWTEPNKSKSKMRFENQPTWDLSRRLNRWESNDFGKGNPAPVAKKSNTPEVQRIINEDYNNPKYKFRKGGVSSIGEILNKNTDENTNEH